MAGQLLLLYILVGNLGLTNAPFVIIGIVSRPTTLAVLFQATTVLIRGIPEHLVWKVDSLLAEKAGFESIEGFHLETEVFQYSFVRIH